MGFEPLDELSLVQSTQVYPRRKRIGVDTLNVREYIRDTHDRAQLTKNLRIYWKQKNVYFNSMTSDHSQERQMIINKWSDANDED